MLICTEVPKSGGKQIYISGENIMTTNAVYRVVYVVLDKDKQFIILH